MPGSTGAFSATNRNRVIVLALLTMFWPIGAIGAEPVNVCTSTSVVDMQRAVATGELPRAEAVAGYAMMPLGGPATIGLKRVYDPGEIDNYRVLVQLGEAREPTDKDLALVERAQVSAGTPPEKDSLRAANLIESRQTLISLNLPAPPNAGTFAGLGWQPGSATVLGCAGAKPVFSAVLRADFSSRITCALATIVLAVLVYALVALAACRSDNKLRPAGRQVRWRRYLDPVVLSSGPNGKGSISRLQILFFSALLFALLFYILVRTGLLSSLSTSILILLGISAVGAAASKGTDVATNRLDFENWAWMISKRWLPEHGLASINLASWRDIVTAEDGFDVYHFQMLIFSLVVGVALLQLGFGDLANFTVPETLLGVLGLSQAVYIGGKLVASPGCRELNDAISELRKRETAFVVAALPGAAAPATLAEARQRAPQQYSSFVEQVNVVKPMFTNVLGEFQGNSDFEPRFT